jgi:transposase-like protein
MVKRRKRRSFTDEFKADAVKVVLAGGRTVGQVAKDLDLTETALRAWVRQAEVDAGQGTPEALTSDERNELARLRREVKQLRTRQDAALAAKIAQTHERSRGRYGSPRVHAELRAAGVRVSRKRVARIMRAEGLAARRKRRYSRTTDSKHSDPIAPNLLERDFHADAPNRVWVTDVTCVWTAQGWLF